VRGRARRAGFPFPGSRSPLARRPGTGRSTVDNPPPRRLRRSDRGACDCPATVWCRPSVLMLKPTLRDRTRACGELQRTPSDASARDRKRARRRISVTCTSPWRGPGTGLACPRTGSWYLLDMPGGPEAEPAAHANPRPPTPRRTGPGGREHGAFGGRLARGGGAGVRPGAVGFW
jgi:hypothetical protein